MSKKLFFILLFIVVAVNALGLYCDIFTQDSSLYAAIAKSLSTSGDYINIYVNGEDWLDKPHFPFWVGALFIHLLGASAFAYKLPSLLFFIIGIVFTYKLAKKLYNINVARIAVLMLGSSIHILLSNNDVRAEAILLGLAIAATYYLYCLGLHFSIKNLLLTALFSAAAVMTKGIFVLIIPYAAVILETFIRRKHTKKIYFQWLIALSTTLVLILPEIYALYQQFDAHPQKVVFGNNNISGIKFFLWDSQFGRFFNTGPIRGEGDIFFYFHTMLWAFAPWAIVGFVALISTLRKLFTTAKNSELITFFGFTIMFLVFSVSQFQLPHYTNILFPFLSIITANVVLQNRKKWIQNTLKISITIYGVCFFIVILLLEYFFRTDYPIIGLIVALILAILIALTYSKKVNYSHKFIILGVLSSALCFVYLNLSFYPQLLQYQAGSQVAFYLNKHYPNKDVITALDDYLLQYHTKSRLYTIGSLSEIKDERFKGEEDKFVVANKALYEKYKENNIDVKLLQKFPNFRITMLHKDFIYHKTREETLSYYYLLKLTMPQETDEGNLN